MGYFLDGIIVAVCLVCVMVGIRRGFIRSIVHFLGSIVAVCLSSILGGILAKWLFDTMFREAMVDKINTSLQGLGAENAAQAAEQILAQLPDFIVRALEDAGVTAAAISGGITAQSSQAAGMITDYLAPVFIGFLKVLAVIVLFFLFMTLVRVLASAVGHMLHLPVLSQVDGLLGGVFGFLLALVGVWVVIAGVLVFTPMLDSTAQQQIDSALDSSIIAGIFVNMNPLKGIFG